MVKYGKEYRKLQVDEWKKYYMDYKGLKRKIREMKQTLFKDLRQTEGARPELLSMPLIPEDLEDIEKAKENEKLSTVYSDEKGEHLREFIELFVQEFKKSYSFFVGIEKVLIKKMNTHLYTQTSYSTYSLSELTKEMKSLSLTIYLAKCLNGFINDIMMAMKKILKKFDKNFSKLFGIITPHLILQLLTKKNSELQYMLDFKIIDEISAISQSNIKELKKFYDQNNENDNIEEKEAFLQKYNETIGYIEDIEELAYFKTQYQEWVDFIGGRNTIRKGFKFFENDIFNPILSSSYYRDNLLDKFLTTKEAFKEAKNMQNSITIENKRNIILLLVQAFFYNSLLSCIFPILYYYEYIRSLDSENKNYNSLWFVNMFLFLVVCSTYFAQFLSIFFFYNYTSKKQIKSSYLLSYTFIFLGSILYILSIMSSQGHFKIRAFILGVSRSLIGLGSNPMVGKKYITMFSPRYYLPLISKIYLIVELTGYIIGPCVVSLLIFLQFGEFFCLFNCIGYYGAIGSFLLFIFHCIYFLPPQNENFSIMKNTIKGDISNSFSQTIDKHFEDVEDTQDKEFYKLQKEKSEKKNNKSKLEVTKSDEINIEINDNENSKIANKTINNTIDSNLNDEKQKEDEDNNYNKIMEAAGDILGQNEIADSYYNNVDIGRYSDLDISNISNDQRQTLEDIETKLNQYQEKSNFTYINMIPRTLDDIILKEQKTFGYMNKNLLIMFILLLFNNLIKENLIANSSYFMLFKVYNDGDIISGAENLVNQRNRTNKGMNDENITNNIDINYYMEIINYINNNNTCTFDNKQLAKDILKYSKNNRESIQLICLLTSVELILQLASFYFIIPFYKINLFFKKNLIIFMVASIIFMIPLSFEFFFGRIYLYVPFVTIVIFMHKIIEIICSSYLVHLIPPKWQYSHIRASSLPIYLMILGKMIGCFICCLSYEKESIEYNQHVITGIAITIYGLMGLFIYKSRDIRINTLPRILRERTLE